MIDIFFSSFPIKCIKKVPRTEILFGTDFIELNSDINKNLTQNTAGQFVLPNGLKICWGTNALDYANGHACQKAIPFPFLFTSTPTVIAVKHILNDNYANGSLDITVKASVRAVCTSSFVGGLHAHDGGFTSDNSSYFGISWLAIGY